MFMSAAAAALCKSNSSMEIGGAIWSAKEKKGQCKKAAFALDFEILVIGAVNFVFVKRLGPLMQGKSMPLQSAHE